MQCNRWCSAARQPCQGCSCAFAMAWNTDTKTCAEHVMMRNAQALQLESGQNIELRDDLTALSAELHRLQTQQAAAQQAQASVPSAPQPAPLPVDDSAVSPTAEDTAADAQASTAAQEEAQRLRRVRSTQQ